MKLQELLDTSGNYFESIMIDVRICALKNETYLIEPHTSILEKEQNPDWTYIEKNITIRKKDYKINNFDMIPERLMDYEVKVFRITSFDGMDSNMFVQVEKEIDLVDLSRE